MYVEGFLLPVKTAAKADYVARSKKAAEAFRRHGALSVMDAWGEGLDAGKLTSFPRAVMLEADETCVLGWNTYPDRATRDACWAAVMQDPEMEGLMDGMPTDGKRMIFGGFETIVEA